jgi:hypothetical protein
MITLSYELIGMSTTDPFWCQIYRPILRKTLAQLERKAKFHAPFEIHTFLVHGIIDMGREHVTRSEAQLFLHNVQFQLDHTELDPVSLDILNDMKGMLHDIEGKNTIRDIQFFLDFREINGAYAETIDRYILNTIFFVEFDSIGDMGRGGATILLKDLFATNATFSDEAIKRFYHRDKHDDIKYIPICSRLAMCYWCHDPMGSEVPHVKMQKLQTSRVASDVAIGRRFSDLLRPFAEPLYVEKAKCLYMLKTNKSINVELKTLEDGLKTLEGIPKQRLTLTTTSETPVFEDLGAFVGMVNYEGVYHKHPPVVVEMNIDAVRDKNICIRIQEWIVPCVSGVGNWLDEQNVWMLPGLSLIVHTIHRISDIDRLKEPCLLDGTLIEAVLAETNNVEYQEIHTDVVNSVLKVLT